jgi:hypothetical protein
MNAHKQATYHDISGIYVCIYDVIMKRAENTSKCSAQKMITINSSGFYSVHARCACGYVRPTHRLWLSLSKTAVSVDSSA